MYKNLKNSKESHKNEQMHKEVLTQNFIVWFSWSEIRLGSDLIIEYWPYLGECVLKNSETDKDVGVIRGKQLGTHQDNMVC